MKLALSIIVLLTAAFVWAQANSPGVTFVGHDKVLETLQKGGALASGADYGVTGGHRDKAGQPELHEKDTEIVLVMDGEATYVTGGTMVDDKQLRPGERRGSDIKGGETRRLTKGDFIVIPAGTPHWFKEVPKSVSYYVVKVLKP